MDLIDNQGSWSSAARIDKVLTFLETRELNSNGYPFWFYQAVDGKNFAFQSDAAKVPVDTVDTGRLFVALNNLKDFNPQWKDRINNIVYNNVTGQVGKRSDYAALLPNIRSESSSNSIYAYYVTSGFAYFWTEVSDVPPKILNNIVTGDPVKFDGNTTLPKSEISCETLLNSFFELKNNPEYPKLVNLTQNVYLVHEAKYNATGQYVAFSEGNCNAKFIYEWVVLADGQKWKVTTIDRSSYDINPIIYNKVAMSFLALYNTTFSRDMVVYLEKILPDPSLGYCDGADYNDQSDGRTVVSMIGSNTNGLILEAARYAYTK